MYKIKTPLPDSFPQGNKPLNGLAPACERADTILMSKLHLNLRGP